MEKFILIILKPALAKAKEIIFIVIFKLKKNSNTYRKIEVPGKNTIFQWKIPANFNGSIREFLENSNAYLKY